MIPKIKKIKKSLFKEIFLFGKSINTKTFNIRERENKNNLPHFSFIISKKIFKKAVDRNKAKRMFFNTIKKIDRKETNKDYIFIIKKNIKELNRNEIEKEIKDFFKK